MEVGVEGYAYKGKRHREKWSWERKWTYRDGPRMMEKWDWDRGAETQEQ